MISCVFVWFFIVLMILSFLGLYVIVLILLISCCRKLLLIFLFKLFLIFKSLFNCFWRCGILRLYIVFVWKFEDFLFVLICCWIFEIFDLILISFIKVLFDRLFRKDELNLFSCIIILYMNFLICIEVVWIIWRILRVICLLKLKIILFVVLFFVIIFLNFFVVLLKIEVNVLLKIVRVVLVIFEIMIFRWWNEVYILLIIWINWLFVFVFRFFVLVMKLFSVLLLWVIVVDRWYILLLILLV